MIFLSCACTAWKSVYLEESVTSFETARGIASSSRRTYTPARYFLSLKPIFSLLRTPLLQCCCLSFLIRTLTDICKLVKKTTFFKQIHPFVRLRFQWFRLCSNSRFCVPTVGPPRFELVTKVSQDEILFCVPSSPSVYSCIMT